jgi:peroxiredoxin Q/BCP
MNLRPGQPAPEFDVVDCHGRRLRLADFRGSRNVVLFFYPRDFTSICTAESCGFEEMYDELLRGNTEVIGVSLDTDVSHRDFAKKYGLRFPLVSDRSKELTRAYGALSTIRSILGRAQRLTYVIDTTGTIAGVFEGELSAGPHLKGARALVERLAASDPRPPPRPAPASAT